jgi:hypothetical protein
VVVREKEEKELMTDWTRPTICVRFHEQVVVEVYEEYRGVAW